MVSMLFNLESRLCVIIMVFDNINLNIRYRLIDLIIDISFYLFVFIKSNDFNINK